MNTLFWSDFGKIDCTVRLALMNKSNTHAMFSDLYMMRDGVSKILANKYFPIFIITSIFECMKKGDCAV